MSKNKKCPICKNKIIGVPALSRKDNKTEICSRCGRIEAIEEFIKSIKKENSKMHFKVGALRPFVTCKEIQYGKILKVNKEDETYLIQDIKTRKRYIVDEDDVFIGDD